MTARLTVVMGLVLGFAVALSAEGKNPEKKGKAENSKQQLREGEFIKQTPFGAMKQGPAKETDELKGARFVEVEEQGEVVTFRRSTPFGIQTWKRKRSELSDVEKGLLERYRSRQSGSAEAGGRNNSKKSGKSKTGKSSAKR